VAALCAAAGYPAALLNPIAEATFPRHTTGEALSESEARQLVEAVKTLAEGGRAAEQIAVLIDEYKQRHGERWRDEFWTRTLRAGAIRAARSDGDQHHVPAPGPGGGQRTGEHRPRTAGAKRTDAPRLTPPQLQRKEVPWH